MVCGDGRGGVCGRPGDLTQGSGGHEERGALGKNQHVQLSSVVLSSRKVRALHLLEKHRGE